MPAARSSRARSRYAPNTPGRSGTRVFEDPVAGRPWTFRHIVQGMIDNFLGRESEWRWRLNDEVPVPADVHPLKNPGLELTGPWYPLDMAFNALNSAAPMNMPDFEDASPAHFQPVGAKKQPVSTLCGAAECQRDFRGRAGRQVVRCCQEGQDALLQNRPRRRISGRRAWFARPAFTLSTNTSRSMASPSPD